MNQSNTLLAGSQTLSSHLFHLAGSEATSRSEAIQRLKQKTGIAAIETAENAGAVRVTYDVLHLDAEAVRNLLESAGVSLLDSRWQKMRLAWFSMLDGNQRDNAKHRPACCSKPPTQGHRG